MIECRRINKSYKRPGESDLQVLKEVNLAIGPGEFVAVVGPSGSGKSTLMHILGLLDAPDSGTYCLNGIEVSQMNGKQLASARNSHIGFVFQQFHLLPRATAVENVALPLMYSTLDNPNERAVKALCSVGLQDRINHQPGQLSGGQQQRVAIARALVTNPGLILADEPTGNLDRVSGNEIMKLFRDLNEEGKTVVFITHDMDLAKQAGRILRIEDGHLSEMAQAAAAVGGV